MRAISAQPWNAQVPQSTGWQGLVIFGSNEEKDHALESHKLELVLKLYHSVSLSTKVSS